MIDKEFNIPTTELNRRIAFDFNKSASEIKNELLIYIEELTDEQIDKWTEEGALESIMVDGARKYFHSAGKNFLRTNKKYNEILLSQEGHERAARQYVLSRHIPSVLAHSIENIKLSKPMFSSLGVTPIYGEFDPAGIYTNHTLYNPVNTITGEYAPEGINSPNMFTDNPLLPYLTHPQEWNFYMRITVDANAVPNGEKIRCWMPMPRTDIVRQEYFDEDGIVEEGAHACRYLSKRAVVDKPTVFTNKFTFVSHAECHPLSENFPHPPLVMLPELEEYLSEKAPHIVFSDSLRVLLDKIVGHEDRPYFRARSIFEAMRTMYPWCSAREYSTIENIPNYVISHGHGDCGQITLLFITLCRMAAIPARWQSGFMLHPGYENYHDWAEIYIEGIGWIPVDASFGVQHWAENEAERYFYFGSIDTFRLVVNSDWGESLQPEKLHERSETVDFQRGEVEWSGGNIYFDKWKFQFWVEPV